ncbi:hypothetical protein EES43_25615 [Streptomyces sp. ADI96-02]|nr:hypothetical protein EES43_25615 [Streptomyces sp. ADI96-02]
MTMRNSRTVLTCESLPGAVVADGSGARTAPRPYAAAVTPTDPHRSTAPARTAGGTR